MRAREGGCMAGFPSLYSSSKEGSYGGYGADNGNRIANLDRNRRSYGRPLRGELRDPETAAFAATQRAIAIAYAALVAAKETP